MSPNEKLSIEFAEKYKGKVVGVLYGYGFRKSGERSHGGYKIDIDGHIIHHYLSRVWHRIRESISISEEQLQTALDENALILHNRLGRELVANAQSWELWARQDNNYDTHSRYKKKEIFCKIAMLREFDINKLEQYYDDYVSNKDTD